MIIYIFGLIFVAINNKTHCHIYSIKTVYYQYLFII